MYLLENVVQSYGWGSTSAIAKLLGRPHPSPKPEAELWMGAHPSAPSLVRCGGDSVALSAAVSADPEAWLGPATITRFGPNLPFLLKVLAAERPLSLQAHPDFEQARRGFAAEEAAGVPLDAAARNYKDAGAKPEVLCALGPFEALLGFRRVHDTLRLLHALEAPELAPVVAALAAAPGAAGLQHAFEWLMQVPSGARGKLVEATRAACARVGTRGEFAGECRWAVRLAASYPADVGVIVALLMNLIELQAGDALYVPAGKLHAYLGGVGVELMASSDNVLRGGLTPKHVDAAELLRVLKFDDKPAALVPSRSEGAEQVYVTEAAEFRLSRIALAPGDRFHATRRWGPEILLCVEGELQVASQDGVRAVATQGTALFVTPVSGVYAISGEGVVFRATTGEPVPPA